MTAETATYDERHEAQIRSEVQEWLSGHWSEGKDRREFPGEAVDAGWARPSWPRDLFGRDLPEDRLVPGRDARP